MPTTRIRRIESDHLIRVFSLRQILLCAFLYMSGSALGAEFEAEVEVGVAHTDNLALSPDNPESQLILQVVPTFRLTQDSPRLDANIVYRADAFYYKERDDSAVYSLFDGQVVTTLVQEKLFLEFGGSRSQSVVDPQGIIPVGNLPFSTNRVDRDDLFFGPNFQFPVSGDVVVSGDLRRTWVKFAEPDPSVGQFQVTDYNFDSGSVGIDNYRRGTGFAWALRYIYNNSDYGPQFVNFEYHQKRVELGYWIRPGFRVFASGGRESPWDKPLEPDPEDAFWEAGLARQLGSRRLGFEIAAGERSFGSSRRATLEYAFVRGTTTLTYAETPTTDTFSDFAGGIVQGGFTDFLARPGSTRRFIDKRLVWGVALQWPRTTFSLDLLDSAHENRSLADGTPLGDELVTSASASVTRRFGANTDLVVAIASGVSEFASGLERDLTSASISVRRRIGLRSELSLTYQRQDQSDEASAADPGDPGFSYDSQIIVLSFSRTFF